MVQAVRGRRRTLAAGMVLSSILAALAPSVGPAGAADFTPPGKGPWHGQIVDVETKKPVEGVVVLAVWNERYGSVGGLAGGGYFDSSEVVTGPDGKFMIRRPKRSFNPFTAIQGPEFYIFKPGYGQWRFAGEEGWVNLWWEERDKRYEEAWRRFNSEGGVVLDMPPLKTREERVNFLRTLLTPSADVPPSNTPKFRDAIDDERVFLGLDPPRRPPKERK